MVSKTVIEQCKIESLVKVRKEPEIITGNLKKPWNIDPYTKKGTGVYLLNFKNSSNGFPAMTKHLMEIIKKYRNTELCEKLI